MGLESAGQRGGPGPADSPESTPVGQSVGRGKPAGFPQGECHSAGRGEGGRGQGRVSTYCLRVPLGSCYPDLGKEQ